jgi:hypothetical protein
MDATSLASPTQCGGYLRFQAKSPSAISRACLFLGLPLANITVRMPHLATAPASVHRMRNDVTAAENVGRRRETTSARPQRRARLLPRQSQSPQRDHVIMSTPLSDGSDSGHGRHRVKPERALRDFRRASTSSRPVQAAVSVGVRRSGDAEKFRA